MESIGSDEDANNTLQTRADRAIDEMASELGWSRDQVVQILRDGERLEREREQEHEEHWGVETVQLAKELTRVVGVPVGRSAGMDGPGPWHERRQRHHAVAPYALKAMQVVCRAAMLARKINTLEPGTADWNSFANQIDGLWLKVLGHDEVCAARLILFDGLEKASGELRVRQTMRAIARRECKNPMTRYERTLVADHKSKTYIEAERRLTSNTRGNRARFCEYCGLEPNKSGSLYLLVEGTLEEVFPKYGKRLESHRKLVLEAIHLWNRKGMWLAAQRVTDAIGLRVQSAASLKTERSAWNSKRKDNSRLWGFKG